ncbi:MULTISPECIES: hypothetical protein [unclassified Pseudomonas]|nr:MULTISPECIES: hypothetical protein [unclassified Pseudomonas]UVM50507.1 hypothetical protein LOY38_00055 [Pseudomonas sp. B21-015]WPN58065.1 hypothetical protein QMK51_00060 [Pseudomonas sp. P9_31]
MKVRDSLRLLVTTPAHLRRGAAANPARRSTPRVETNGVFFKEEMGDD